MSETVQKANPWYLIGVVLIAVLGGLLFGYDTAVISGAEKGLQAFFSASQDFDYNESWHGFTSSSALIGSVIGALLSGILASRLGRKKSLFVAGILFFMSALGSYYPEFLFFTYGCPSKSLLVAFNLYRILGGAGVGIASALCPMYIAEIAPASKRGTLVSWNQFAIIFGQLVVYFVNFLIIRSHANDPEVVAWTNSIGWRNMFVSEAVPAALFAFLVLFVPESPRFLVLNGDDAKALSILSKINGADKAGTILKDIKDTAVEKKEKLFSYGVLVVFIGCMLSVFQQIIGINAVLYFAPRIFESMGVSDNMMFTVIMGIINISFTLVAIFTVERLGRKPLLIVGSLGMAVGATAVALSDVISFPSVVPVAGIMLYSACFMFSWGPICWVYISELFPNTIRSQATALAVALQWIFNFLVSATFVPMYSYSPFLAYALYGGICLIAALFVWLLVPETKGKTLEEITQLWRGQGKNSKWIKSLRHTTCLWAGLIVLLVVGCSRQQVVLMKVQWQSRPLGIDTYTPRFTWDYAEDFQQTGFIFNLMSEEGEVLFTDSQEGRQSVYEPSQPLPLRSMKTYQWSVTAVDASGEQISGTASFETAILSEQDWMSVWISDAYSKDTHPSPVLRKVFRCEEAIHSARLYLGAAAYADFRINGKPICSSALNPGYTHYNSRNLYCVYDITSMLEAGKKNEILAVLGNGFYNVIDHTAVWDFDKAAWRGRPAMIAQLYIRYENGAECIVGTDSSWETLADLSLSPYQGDNIYSGDNYDARLDLNAHLPWLPATVVDAPSSRLQAQQMPLNTEEYSLEGRIVLNRADTLFVVAWDENIAGLSAFSIEGSEGTRLSIAHGEQLDSAGRLSVAHMDEHFRALPGHSFQTDTYILREGENKIGGTFSYHGFQYAELHSDRPIRVKEAQARFIHTDFAQTGSFRCSDLELEALRDIVLRSYKSNFMSIPTDCPQREKNGWTADAYTAMEVGLLNFDSKNAYLKWMDDLIDNQRPDGQIMGIVPSHGWGLGIGPVWDAVLFIVPETYYDYTGDLTAIKKMVPVCRNYLNYLRTREVDGGIIPYGLSDHSTWGSWTPCDFSSTCYSMMMHRQMARFLTLLGEDGSTYAARADELKDLINRRFYHSQEESYDTGNQCELALALWLDIVPEGHQEAVAHNLSKAVEACGDHLDYGMIGSKIVLRMLSRYGYVDQAFRMVKNSEPSPIDWVRKGLTTPLEIWAVRNGDTYSMNHVFLGDVAAWMTSDFAGIRPDADNPGFQHTLIAPAFPEGLDWVEASVDTPHGKVSSQWRRSGNSVRMTVQLPSNTTGTVQIDGKEYHAQSGTNRYRFSLNKQK